MNEAPKSRPASACRVRALDRILIGGTLLVLALCAAPTACGGHAEGGSDVPAPNSDGAPSDGSSGRPPGTIFDGTFIRPPDGAYWPPHTDGSLPPHTDGSGPPPHTDGAHPDGWILDGEVACGSEGDGHSDGSTPDGGWADGHSDGSTPDGGWADGHSDGSTPDGAWADGSAAP